MHRCQIKQSAFIGKVLSVAVVLIAVCCFSLHAAEKKKEAVGTDTELKKIVGISSLKGKERDTVLIRSDGKLTYTDVKKMAPLGIILYFPETVIDESLVPVKVDSEVIKGILTSVYKENNTSRIEIQLDRDVSYRISEENSHLRISFEKSAALSAAPAAPQKKRVEAVVVSQPVVTKNQPVVTKNQPVVTKNRSVPKKSETPSLVLNAVAVEKLKDSTVITLDAGKKISLFKSFTIKEPTRIVFDIDGIRSLKKGEEMIPVNSDRVKSVRYYSYPERLRLVIDTEKKFLASYVPEPVEQGLKIKVSGPLATVRQTLVKSTPAPPVKMKTVAAAVVNAPPVKQPAVPTVRKKSVRKKAAMIDLVEFESGKAGESVITIGTSEPVVAEIEAAGDKVLHVNLYNVKVPDYRKRQLITTRFDSAVDRIIPVQTKAMKDTALFIVELRESVTYRMTQSGNKLFVRFDASKVPPKPMGKTTPPDWVKAMDKPVDQVTPGAALPASGQLPGMASAGSTSKAAMPTDVKEFTGEKIALDFFQTDIKNVFRILQSVSGKNFAIDKNVTGKVTLNLDKPVPWDQILDLVLKMNGLGMVYEGDIVRIATQATIKKEEDFRQSVATARRKAIEELRASNIKLEPLVTEYIPLSYVTAPSMATHVNGVLTKDRGSVTVDEHNNQLIVTDTKEVLGRAKDIIAKIDKVTAQVLIEARIVEANKTFSRDLGIKWDILDQATHSSFFGGDLLYESVMDYAVAGSTFGMTYTSDSGHSIGATLSAMETNGDGKIISSPRVLTLDNKEAQIKQGFEVPYTVKDADGNPTTSFKDIDLLLSVTPHVTSDQRVSMTLNITNNDLGEFSVDGVPSVTTKEITTELLVDDGTTIVIGGITKSSFTGSMSGVPGLSKIPGLGQLFRKNQKTESTRELLIFITPKIVRLDEQRM